MLLSTLPGMQLGRCCACFVLQMAGHGTRDLPPELHGRCASSSPISAIAARKSYIVSCVHNEVLQVAEDLLRRVEEESAALPAGAPPAPHLSLTNLALGTLYCAKGGWRARGMSPQR